MKIERMPNISMKIERMPTKFYSTALQRKVEYEQALQMSSSAEQGRHVLMSIQESLNEERKTLAQVTQETVQQRSKRIIAERDLEQILKKVQNFEFMAEQAEKDRNLAEQVRVCACVCVRTSLQRLQGVPCTHKPTLSLPHTHTYTHTHTFSHTHSLTHTHTSIAETGRPALPGGV